MKTDLFVASDVGLYREANEDVGLVARAADPRAGVVLCVADGMGGHPAGEDASRIAIDFAAEYLDRVPRLDDLEGEDLENVLLELFLTILNEAAEAILGVSEADPSRQGLGSTLVAALLLGERCHVLHCGDSRAYLLRGEMLDLLTSDHVLEEGGVRYLEQHLGMPEGLALDHGVFDVQPRDRILVCSDGLTDMLSNRELGAHLRAAETPDEACGRLIEAANEAGGMDNITVAVAFLEEGVVDPCRAVLYRTDEETGDPHRAAGAMS